MSWRNPDARHAGWGLDTYGQAVLDAMAAAERITAAQTGLDVLLLRRHHHGDAARSPGRDRSAGPGRLGDLW